MNALLLVTLLAAGAPTWNGSLQWRGETIVLRSCCGPLKVPVVARQLEKGYGRARADLDAAGFGHVPLPPLGITAHPYTIEVQPELPAECRNDCPKTAVCLGCSTTPHRRARWGWVVVVDKPRNRAAPVNHEMQHRWCALLRPQLVSTAEEILSGGVAKACEWADHPLDKQWRYNVLGTMVRK